MEWRSGHAPQHRFRNLLTERFAGRANQKRRLALRDSCVRNAVKMRLATMSKRRNTAAPGYVCSLFLPATPCCSCVRRAHAPLGDDQRRNPVAVPVRWCERLRHQPVDADDKGDTLDRDRSDGGECRREYDERKAGRALSSQPRRPWPRSPSRQSRASPWIHGSTAISN